MRIRINSATSLAMLLLLVRCAQIVPLSGGQKDASPPKFIAADPENGTSSFDSKTIELTFDEFIQLRDLNNQLIISPTMEKLPEITALGKKVQIKIDPKILKPQTTYRFSFGNSIADMTESNPLTNFEYIFSTGTQIDSLKLSGTVSDAFEARPAGNVIVGLYSSEENSDSLPFKKVPDYIARTNESGAFEFKNLPPKQFRAFAIGDKNKNFLYEVEAEKVGFVSQNIMPGTDSSLQVRIFPEESGKAFIKKTISSVYGLSQIILNRELPVKVNAIGLRGEAQIMLPGNRPADDTIVVLYKGLTDTLNLAVQIEGQNKIDTIRLGLPKLPSAKTFFKTDVRGPSTEPPPASRISVRFSQWMDTSKVNLLRIDVKSPADSLIALSKPTLRWKDLTEAELHLPFKPGFSYTFRADTGTFYNIRGQTNDSLRLTFKTREQTEFGKLSLKVKLNRKQNYVIQLLNEKGQAVQQQQLALSLSSSNALTVEFPFLEPGNYQAKLIYDDNKNGKWDSGNLLLRQQPEKITVFSKQFKVMADWEIEEEIAERD